MSDNVKKLFSILNDTTYCNFKGNEVEKIINEYPDLVNTVYNGETPLLAACRSNSDVNVQILLKKGADHSILTETGKSVIDLLYESHKNADCIWWLVSIGECLVHLVNNGYVVPRKYNSFYVRMVQIYNDTDDY